MIIIAEKKIMDKFSLTEEDLMKKPLGEVIKLNKEVISEKDGPKVPREEFDRLVRKFFTPFDYLTGFISEEKILDACYEMLDVKELAVEKPYKEGSYVPKEAGAEFLRKDMATLRRFARNGEELLYGERCMCDIYRVKNPNQGIYHGKVMLKLLYDLMPEVKKYNWEAYAFTGYGDGSQDAYEIYLGISFDRDTPFVYCPYRAVITGDIVSIVNRNMDYARSYNGGAYTPELTKKRLSSEFVTEAFDTIKREAERVKAERDTDDLEK